MQLTQQQIKYLEDGSTMFIVPICEGRIEKFDKYFLHDAIVKTLIGEATVQKGDKDIFIQEEFITVPFTTDILYKADGHPNSSLIQWENASTMIKEQSRYSFNECIDVRVLKVQNNIKIKDWVKIIPNDGTKLSITISEYCKQNNISKNDYVFLIEFKR